MVAHTLTVSTHPASLDTPIGGGQKSAGATAISCDSSYTNPTSGAFYLFACWTSADGAIADKYAISTTFTMPDSAAEVTANYVLVPDAISLLTSIKTLLQRIAGAI